MKLKNKLTVKENIYMIIANIINNDEGVIPGWNSAFFVQGIVKVYGSGGECDFAV